MASKMRELLLVAVAGFAMAGMNLPTLADTQFEDSIPIELAKALLGGRGIEVQFYQDIPGHFPAVALPQGMELLGSVDRGHGQQIILRTEGSGTEQRAAIMASLEQDNYLTLTRSPVNPAQTGFVATHIIPAGMPVQLCHDTRGMANIRLHPRTDHTIVDLTMSPGNGISCSQMATQMAGPLPFQRGGGLALHNLMPRLELPFSATPPPAQPPFMNISSSNTGADSRIEFEIAWSLEDIYRHFAEQIDAQEWQLDVESIGNRAAQGLWLLEVDDQQLLGTLRLVSQGEESYLATFSISLLN